jgi:transcriptional regulator with XRE-family HTH domain
MNDTQPQDQAPADPQLSDGDLDANALVAANLRSIRARRGWTQIEVAERLSRLNGHKPTQASISAMEVGGMNGRRRRFDADELYLLAEVFGVPVIYFLLPDPGDQRVAERLCRLLGPDEQSLDDRLRELSRQTSSDSVTLTAAMSGGGPESRVALDDYRRWRSARLEALEQELWTDLERLADVLAGLGEALRTCGPDGFLRHLEGATTAIGPVFGDETAKSAAANLVP